MLCGINYSEIQISLKSVRCVIKLRVSYFLFLWKFPGPWEHQQTLLALPSFHWASPFPACRARTQFQLSPGLSVPVQNILLVCLFQPFPWPCLLLLLMGSPASSVDLGLGLLVDPATSPRLCPPRSAPVGLGALGDGMACAGSPLTPMPLGSSWPLLLPDTRFWSMDFFFFFFLTRSTFSVQLCSTV